jgi:hypothetical protein
MVREMRMTKAKKPQGFACLSAEERHEVASRGGHASQASGKAFAFDSETGRRAALIAVKNRKRRTKKSAGESKKTTAPRTVGAIEGMDTQRAEAAETESEQNGTRMP